MKDTFTDKIDHVFRDPNEGTDETSAGLVSSKNNQIPSPPKNNSDIVLSRQTFSEKLFSWRSFMGLLLHISCIIYVMPILAFPMALVCMCGPIRPYQNDTSQNSINEFQQSNYTAVDNYDNGTVFQNKVYEFNWDSETRGLLISGILFGNFLVPVLSNVIRGYLGNKLSLTIYSLVLAFLWFVLPVIARTNLYMLLVVRILTGLCVHANAPVVGDTMAWWSPAQEKLTRVTIVVSGWAVAGILSPLITGLFCLLTLDNGWPLIYYFNGSALVVWTIAWYLLSSRRPEDHPFISEKEKDYIVGHRVGMSHATKKSDKTPYKTILTSQPIIVFAASVICNMWVIVLMASSFPAYLTSVLRFSLQEAGVLLSLMYAFRLLALLFWSAVGNWLLQRKSMNTNKVRKICLGCGQTMAFVFSLGVSFLDERHKWVASTLMVLMVFSSAFGSTISNVVPLDMAPRHAGFITGLGISLSNAFSVTAPMLVAALTPTGSYEEWRLVWIILAIVNLSAGWVFVIFGNASLQSWAVTPVQENITKPSIKSS